MIKRHSEKSNCDIIFPRGIIYDKNTFIKTSWGTAYDTKEVVRVDWNKT